MAMLDINCNHMAPGPVIRERLRSCLDFEKIGDGQDLDRANDEGHPDLQAIYVEFAGEINRSGLGTQHAWRVWLVQRRDMPDWEASYGTMRAGIVNALHDWQPGADMDAIELQRGECAVADYPGLRVDLTVWLVSELKFSR